MAQFAHAMRVFWCTQFFNVLVMFAFCCCRGEVCANSSIHTLSHTHTLISSHPTHSSDTPYRSPTGVNVVRRYIRPPFSAVFCDRQSFPPTLCDVSTRWSWCRALTSTDEHQPYPSRTYVQYHNMSQIGRPIKSLEAPRPLKSLSRPTLPSTTYEVQSSEYWEYGIVGNISNITWMDIPSCFWFMLGHQKYVLQRNCISVSNWLLRMAK